MQRIWGPALVVLQIIGVGLNAEAQVGGRVDGTVRDGQDLALPGATVVLRTGAGSVAALTVTDRRGEFTVDEVAPGDYVLGVSLLGFTTHEETVAVSADGAQVAVVLTVGSFTQEVTVSALMPGLATELVTSANRIERQVARDLAQSLRSHPGVTAVRRGSVNLDPSVRGLYAEQIGVFVDGTRTFAAGPARMDSGLSHVSPHALQALRVVRGPYALTWGAGALSAIRAETFRPEYRAGPLEVNGRGGYNFRGNGASSDGFGSVYGSSERFRFLLQANARIGGDYTDGNGTTVQGDYESLDSRWGFGARLSARTQLDYSGGIQHQNDLDYPGRILDATFFRTQSHALEIAHRRETGLLSEVGAQVYVNAKDHLMNNHNKPSALPNPQRTPPFPIRIDLPATADTVGGRFHVALEDPAGRLRHRFGGDFYRLGQEATQSVSNRSTGAIHVDRHPVWPEARLTNGGVYAQTVYERGRGAVAGTVRVDHERARVGDVTMFFAHNGTPPYALDRETGRFPCVTATCLQPGGMPGHGMGSGLVSGDHLAQSNTNLSAAGNATFRVTDTWLLTAGVGRVARNPSALERFADRFPAVKFQTSAEFVGNPSLVPEQSLEYNVATTLAVRGATLGLDAFVRRISDYITVAPDPNVAKRLPLSPETVFRYVQADEARFAGFDATAEAPAGPWLDLRASWSYVRAEDVLFGEPVFGVPPFEQRYAVELHNPARTRRVELVVTSTAAQEQVAARRLETMTAGWTTIDLLADVETPAGVTLRAGVHNLTDTYYVNHLNSLNPFTLQRIAEVGRSVYVGTEFAF